MRVGIRVGAASCLAFCLAAGIAGVSSSARADVAISEEARTHFAAGVALLQDPKAPRYEEAYREFKAAYAASPSYKILGNLGLCAMKIERDLEAIQAYETYLKEAGADVTAEQRQQVTRDLLTLRSGLMEVTVSSTPPGATIVDVRTPVEGQDVRNTYGPLTTALPLGLRHGHHTITARLVGYQDQQWEFDATSGKAPPHIFALQKVVSGEHAVVLRDRPIPTAAYVTGGITVALAVGGAYFGALAIGKRNDFNSLNDGMHVSQAQSARSSGETLNVVTDSLFGAAIVGAVVTTYLVLARGTTERPAEAGATGATGTGPAGPTRSTSAWVPSLAMAPGAPTGGGFAWHF
jgi:hypothetical protein